MNNLWTDARKSIGDLMKVSSLSPYDGLLLLAGYLLLDERRLPATGRRRCLHLLAYSNL
jgi:hypothetical protein